MTRYFVSEVADLYGAMDDMEIMFRHGTGFLRIVPFPREERRGIIRLIFEHATH